MFEDNAVTAEKTSFNLKPCIRSSPASGGISQTYLTFFVLSGSDNNLYGPMIHVLFRQLLSLDRMSKADKQLVA